eukprot:scaffold1031_cov461-Prasinococcus_capsulatus_cf.AAC.14
MHPAYNGNPGHLSNGATAAHPPTRRAAAGLLPACLLTAVASPTRPSLFCVSLAGASGVVGGYPQMGQGGMQQGKWDPSQSQQHGGHPPYSNGGAAGRNGSQNGGNNGNSNGAGNNTANGEWGNGNGPPTSGPFNASFEQQGEPFAFPRCVRRARTGARTAVVLRGGAVRATRRVSSFGQLPRNFSLSEFSAELDEHMKVPENDSLLLQSLVPAHSTDNLLDLDVNNNSESRPGLAGGALAARPEMTAAWLTLPVHLHAGLWRGRNGHSPCAPTSSNKRSSSSSKPHATTPLSVTTAGDVTAVVSGSSSDI